MSNEELSLFLHKYSYPPREKKNEVSLENSTLENLFMIGYTTSFLLVAERVLSY